jgi:hypothetical protein
MWGACCARRAENRIDLLMQASNPALLAAAGIRERRQGLVLGPPPITHE